MKFEQEPTDQQLDQQLNKLLQDVDVPQDLNALLKQIPLQSQDEDGELASDSISQLNQRSKSKSKTWIGLILAASLIGFGLFVASGYLRNPNDVKPLIANSANINSKITEPNKSLAVVEEEKSETRSVELEIEDREVQILEAQIHAIETVQLEAQVLRAEQAVTFPTDQREVESLIAAMTEEYSIPLGMPEAKVKLAMAQVIQDFPGTQGASIAQSYLKRTQNN